MISLRTKVNNNLIGSSGYSGYSGASGYSGISGYSGKSAVGTFSTYKYTATASQTIFSGTDDVGSSLAYTVGLLLVTLNGVILENGSEYTATNGTSIVLTSSASLSDELNVYAFSSFDIANTYTQAQINNFLNARTGKEIAMSMIFGG